MKIRRMYLLWCMFLVPLVQFAQITVEGMVSDEATQEPLPGVSVVIKGTAQGTATDFDGNYVLQANVGDILVFFLHWVSTEGSGCFWEYAKCDLDRGYHFIG